MNCIVSIWGHLQGVKIESKKISFETFIWIEAIPIFDYLTIFIKTTISKISEEGIFEQGQGVFQSQ